METKHIEKIAKMVMVNVPQNQIASACGVSEGRITQLMNTTEYKEVEQKVALVRFQEDELINNGWDSVEAMSVKNILVALRNNPEPDFSLRAANVANKAVRRGTFNNQPINPQSAGIRAVIQLNPVFVDKLQQNFNISADQGSKLVEKPKDSDFMPAADVHNLLGLGNAEDKLKALDVSTPVTSPEIDELNSLPDMDKLELDT